MKRYDEVAGAGWSVLTARERDVIEPVAEGKSNKVIAIDLGISMRTVEAHRARIFYKMGVRNAVQLARELCTNPPQPWPDRPSSPSLTGKGIRGRGDVSETKDSSGPASDPVL